MINIVETIREETASYLSSIAVKKGDREITYRELLGCVDSFAGTLTETGVKRGDIVALKCPDSIEYIVSSLALLSIKAVMVPVSVSMSDDEVKNLLEKIQVNHFLYSKKHCSENGRALPGIPLLKLPFGISTLCSDNLHDDRFNRLNPAFIRFSSGTTGASKGVILSHEAVIERTSAADKALKLTNDDNVIWVLSMSFHFVVTILLFLRRAVTIIICSENFPLALKIGLENNKATFMYASPFHYKLMAQSGMFPPDIVKEVRMAVSTAVKLPISVTKEFSDKFGFELSEAYGIIEVGLPFINTPVNAKKQGSVGKHLPDYDLKIIEPDSDGVGHVCIKGPGMFGAYFNPFKTLKEIFPEGWFNTGDLGYLDKEGYLYLVGRQKNLINFTGMKIFPDEVESVLQQHPLISDVIIYGEDSDQYGEIPCAKIVLTGEHTKETEPEIRKFCYEHLASYKVPKKFTYTNKIEKTASGKIKRF